MTSKRLVTFLAVLLVAVLSGCGGCKDADSGAGDSSASEEEDTKAAIVIGIHGLGAKPSEEDLADAWSRAIDSGLALVGESGLSSLGVDFELVYWAAEEESTVDCVLVDEAERSVFRRLVIEAREALNSLPDTSALVDSFGDFDESVDFERLLEVFPAGVHADLRNYYSDDVANCEASPRSGHRDCIRQTLVSALEAHQGKRILLAAHSMGSIVAYDVLRQREDLTVERLVTIGSPLGLGPIQRLNREEWETLSQPAGVVWTNLADRLDKVAADGDLADDYDRPDAATPAIEDKQVINQKPGEDGLDRLDLSRFHDICGYLQTEEFSSLVAEFAPDRG